jgi:hypothetical protein
VLKRKIRGFEKTSVKLDKMGDYKSKDEVDFAILTLEELLETYETGIECDIEN